MKILLVEDDAELSNHLSQVLKESGHSVSPILTMGALEQSLAGGVSCELIVLDRMMSGRDTKLLMDQLRATWPAAGILILSAISTPEEKTELINLGADDYLGKPFSTKELLARINALGRRRSPVTRTEISLGNTLIDDVKKLVVVNGRSEKIPSKEFLVLKVLGSEPGRVWSRADLLQSVWETTAAVETNVVEATITNLRRHLASLESNIKIKNMRNSGYWVEE